MILDKFYCAKLQQSLYLQQTQNKISLVVGDKEIIGLYDIAKAMSQIEHKPNHKLFSSPEQITRYLNERLGLTK
jgi:hypothetical protein